MRDLVRRVEKLEEQVLVNADCTCGRNIVLHFAGEPMPERKQCPAHGEQGMLSIEYIAWPLPRTSLDL